MHLIKYILFLTSILLYRRIVKLYLIIITIVFKKNYLLYLKYLSVR